MSNKMLYDGQEVDLITEGYWPDGVTLIARDESSSGLSEYRDVICLHNNMAFLVDGDTSFKWALLAIKPATPAPRRLTNREVLGLCRNGYDICYNGFISTAMHYDKNKDDSDVNAGVRLRAPGSDEWREPTTELLEVGK